MRGILMPALGQQSDIHDCDSDIKEIMTRQIDLEDDEALVLFELIASGKLQPNTDKAEALVLDAVRGCLEKQLAEPFAADYLELLESAKSSVLKRRS